MEGTLLGEAERTLAVGLELLILPELALGIGALPLPEDLLELARFIVGLLMVF